MKVSVAWGSLWPLTRWISSRKHGSQVHYSQEKQCALMIFEEEIPQIQCHPNLGSPQKQNPTWWHWGPFHYHSWAMGPAGCWRQTQTSWSHQMLAARKMPPNLSHVVKAHYTHPHSQFHWICRSKTLPTRDDSWLNSPQHFSSMWWLTWSLSNSQAENIQKIHFQHWQSPMSDRGSWLVFHPSSLQPRAWEDNWYSQTHTQESVLQQHSPQSA